jgi:hypothetical protein
VQTKLAHFRDAQTTPQHEHKYRLIPHILNDGEQLVYLRFGYASRQALVVSEHVAMGENGAFQCGVFVGQEAVEGSDSGETAVDGATF